ncbi:CRISPR-associated endonuclease Cas2 [Fibrobacter sp.]|uniref:CRISPR-associated endonuclease Cas2 n=1 Tax=Fibrobacter sp. TaxID=35828 RepID=UPI00345C7728
MGRSYFDFPRHCKSGRQNMNRFASELEKEGFSRVQRGMYVRYSTTADNGRIHRRRVANFIKPRSTVCLLSITDREFSEVYSHFGSTKPPKNGQNVKNPSNFSDFFSVKPLANPHKIRYIQRVHLIGALYEPRKNPKGRHRIFYY